jgi:flagellar motor switch protein FliM
MGDVLSLKVGDTIQLDQYVSEPIPMMLEGVPKFQVQLGTHCGQQAVQVVAMADPE